MEFCDNLGHNDSKTVSVKPLENGWLVIVTNPFRPIDPTEKMYRAIGHIIPQINAAAGAGIAQGIDEEMDAYKARDVDRVKAKAEKAALLQGAIEDAFADKKSIRKPIETYCFIDFNKMLEFLKEELKPS